MTEAEMLFAFMASFSKVLDDNPPKEDEDDYDGEEFEEPEEADDEA